MQSVTVLNKILHNEFFIKILPENIILIEAR